jgi:hypothetical protein
MQLDSAKSLARALSRRLQKSAFRRDGRARRGRRVLQMEWLEARLNLSAVTWTGLGGDFQWDDAANWSPAQIPTSANDVVIDDGGSNAFTVIASGTDAANSLVDHASLSISGGSLSLSAPSSILGTLNLGVGGTLAFGGTLAVAGLTHMLSPDSPDATIRGVGNSATLVAAGGLFIDSSYATLDHVTIQIPRGATASITASDVYDQNGVSIDNAGTITYTSDANLWDDGASSLTNEPGALLDFLISHDPHVMQFATLTNLGTIQVEPNASVTFELSGSALGNAGLIEGGVGSHVGFDGGLTQDPTAGRLDTAGAVGIGATGVSLAGYYSAASTFVAGTAESTLAFTGTVARLGVLNIESSTVDLTAASFGPTGRTLDALDVTYFGTLITSGTISVTGQARFELPGTQGYNATLRGVGDGAQLIAAGGAYFDNSDVVLDHVELKIPADTTTTINGDNVRFNNGASIDNAGKLNLQLGYLSDDGTGSLVNEPQATIDASYYDASHTANSLNFATLTNTGTINLEPGCQLTLGDAGYSVFNSGSITGGLGSSLGFYGTLEQDATTGTVDSAGSVGFSSSGSPTLAGFYSAAVTNIGGPSNTSFAFTGTVARLGVLNIESSTVDLTAASFGPTGRTLDALDVTYFGTLITSGTISVTGQARFELPGTQGYNATLRGVGDGAQLIAAGGAYFDNSDVVLDHVELKIPADTTTTINGDNVRFNNGASIDNAGKLNLQLGYLSDDGTGSLVNEPQATIDASYYDASHTANSLNFATLTNTGTINLEPGCQLTLGDAGYSVFNSGSITGGLGSSLGFYGTLEQDATTGSLDSAGSVGFSSSDSPSLAGFYSAAVTNIGGPSNTSFAFTGTVARLGVLNIESSDVDLTAASFGPTGRTLDALDVTYFGTLITSGTISVTGQARVELSGTQGDNASFRGVGNGAQLIAAGGARFYNSNVVLDHVALEIPADTTSTFNGDNVSFNNGASIDNAGTLDVNAGSYLDILDGSTLIEEIGGLVAGAQYGRIVVSSPLNLAGNLQVTLADGFIPQLGQQFTVICNQGPDPIQGTFTSLPEGSTVWAGTYGFTVSYVGGTDHRDLVLTASVVTVKPTLTVGSATIQYDGNSHPAGFTITALNNDDLSGLVSVTYTDAQNNVATIPPVHAGTYLVTASFPANANDLPVTATGTLTITTAAISVTIGNDSHVYGRTANLTADLPATFNTGISDQSLSIAYSSAGTTTTAPVNTYAITGVVSDGTGMASDYTVTLTNGTLTVTKANAAIVVAPYSVCYDSSPHTATGNATGVGSDGPLSGLDLSGTTHSNAGTYTDTWTFIDVTGNYKNAMGTVADEIDKADALISVTPYHVNYDSSAHTATGSATGVGSDGALSGFDLGGTTHSNAGAYASDAWTFNDVTGNYKNATGTVSDSIAKATATVSVTSYSVTYDGNAHTATGTVTGVGSDGALSGLDFSGTTHANVGAYASDAWTFTDVTGDYNNAAGTISDSIGKSGLTITAGNVSKIYGNTNPGFTVSYAGFVNGETAKLLGGTLNFTTSATASSPVGTYSVTPTGLTSSNYAITFVPGILTVSTNAGSIYVLDASASAALNVTGNASLKIIGDLVVDSSSNSAVSASGNALVTAASVQVFGGTSVSGNAKVTGPLGKPGALGDPFAGLAAPVAVGPVFSVNLGGNSTQTISPGAYSSIAVSGNAKLTLNPGTYVIAGGGVSVSGNAGIAGAGVSFYNAGSNVIPGSGTPIFGGIGFTGNGLVQLSAPVTGTYAGVLVFQARDNTRALSLSGNAALGISGMIYAPKALLNIIGNAQLQSHVPMVVDELQLSGSGSSSLNTDGAGTAAGELLAGNLSLYVDDPSGYLDSNARARIDDAITNLDNLLVPYSVTVTLSSEVATANLVLDTAVTSAAGGYAEGVLGCYTNTGEITLVRGWNWFTGSDPASMDADQFDFETIVSHELGHALGLGHSGDPASTMFASLGTNEARRYLTTADLGIRDADGGPDGLHAALPGVAKSAVFGIGTRAVASANDVASTVSDAVATAMEHLDQIHRAPKSSAAAHKPTPTRVAMPSRVRLNWIGGRANAAAAASRVALHSTIGIRFEAHQGGSPSAWLGVRPDDARLSAGRIERARSQPAPFPVAGKSSARRVGTGPVVFDRSRCEMVLVRVC